MFTYFFYFLVFLCKTLSSPENEFVVISTTKRPSELQTLNTIIDEKINGISYRLQVIETKNQQCTTEEKINGIKDALERIESRTDENTIEATMKGIQQRIEDHETKIQQLQTLESRLNIIDKKINEIHQRFEGLESKLQDQKSSNEQISQTLKTINSTLSQLINDHDAVLPQNCQEVQQRGHNISKIYQIKPYLSSKPIGVLCDLKRRGGGWTYIVNRFDGSKDFNLMWNNYKIGFGSPVGEFWLGLDNIHYLTGYEVNELLVELVDWKGKEVYAHYETFSVGSESDGYSLNILGKYKGTAGNSLRYSAKMKFTTVDNDQDRYSENCAKVYGGGGGWWYDNCMLSLLTGKYYKENATIEGKTARIYWSTFHGSMYSLKQARMLIRPQNINSEFLPHDKTK